MNYMYPVYIFLGNVAFWPLTMLVSVFWRISRFLAFATMAVIAGLVIVSLFGYSLLMGHLLTAAYIYLAIGLVVAIAVTMNMFTRDDLPEVFYILAAMALGVLVGTAVGWAIHL